MNLPNNQDKEQPMRSMTPLLIVCAGLLLLQACAVPKMFEDIDHPVLVGTKVIPGKTVDDFTFVIDREVRELLDVKKSSRETRTPMGGGVTRVTTTTRTEWEREASIRPVFNYIDENNLVGSVNWIRNHHIYVIWAYKRDEFAMRLRVYLND
jgi:hypothetical protein